MVRVGGTGVILRVAGVARSRSAGELIVQMACGTVELGVHATQSESREFQVVELRPHPRIHAVAAVACNGETARAVVKHGCCKLLRVTEVAIGA